MEGDDAESKYFTETGAVGVVFIDTYSEQTEVPNRFIDSFVDGIRHKSLLSRYLIFLLALAIFLVRR
jgi:hypothetical protein